MPRKNSKKSQRSKSESQPDGTLSAPGRDTSQDGAFLPLMGWTPTGPVAYVSQQDGTVGVDGVVVETGAPNNGVPYRRDGVSQDGVVSDGYGQVTYGWVPKTVIRGINPAGKPIVEIRALSDGVAQTGVSDGLYQTSAPTSTLVQALVGKTIHNPKEYIDLLEKIGSILDRVRSAAHIALQEDISIESLEASIANMIDDLISDISNGILMIEEDGDSGDWSEGQGEPSVKNRGIVFHIGEKITQ